MNLIYDPIASTLSRLEIIYLGPYLIAKGSLIAKPCLICEIILSTVGTYFFVACKIFRANQ
jgi:hypothetical protein